MTDYYVDATGGNDGWPGTYAQPWQTLNKINISAFNPGDNIYLKGGEVWAGQNLLVPSSGNGADPITFGPYGSGDNPLANALLEYNDFIADVGFKWKRTHAPAWMGHVFEDGARLIKAASYVAMVQGSWFLDDPADLLYVWCTDDGNPNTAHVLEHPATWRAPVDPNGQDYLVFENIDAKGGQFNGYTFEQTVGSIYVTVRKCVSSWNVGRGFGCGGTTDLQLQHISFVKDIAHRCLGEGFWIGNGSDILVDDCEAYDIFEDQGKGYTGDGGGVLVGIRAVDCIVEDTHVHDIYEGISLMVEFEAGYARPSNTIVQRNLIDPGATGAPAYPVVLEGSGTAFKNNIVIGARDTSVVVVQDGSTGEKIYHNTLVKKGSAGWLMALIQGTNLLVKNNILHSATFPWMIGVWNGAKGGLDIDYNCHYNTAGYVYYWEGGAPEYPASFASWKTVSGKDANSINVDPLCKDMAGDNFRLRNTSPCREAGTDVGVTDDHDRFHREIRALPDIGPFEYRTTIRRPFAWSKARRR